MNDSGPDLVDVLELRQETIERRCHEFDEIGAIDRDPAEIVDLLSLLRQHLAAEFAVLYPPLRELLRAHVAEDELRRLGAEMTGRLAAEFSQTPHVHPAGPGEAARPADLAAPPADADEGRREGEQTG